MQSSVGPEAAARSRCPADINALTLCWIEGLLGQEPYYVMNVGGRDECTRCLQIREPWPTRTPSRCRCPGGGPCAVGEAAPTGRQSRLTTGRETRSPGGPSTERRAPPAR